MQNKEIIGKTEGITKVNKIQGLLNNINNKSKLFSNENDIFNQYIQENNNLNDMEILRPTPLRNYKDTFFLGKKRAGNNCKKVTTW